METYTEYDDEDYGDLLTYRGATEVFYDNLRIDTREGHPPKSGQQAETMHLWSTDEKSLTEAERMKCLLPLIKWEVDNGLLTEWMSDELYLYYEDYVNGRLDWLEGDREAEAVIRDLTDCFHRAFPEGVEV